MYTARQKANLELISPLFWCCVNYFANGYLRHQLIDWGLSSRGMSMAVAVMYVFVCMAHLFVNKFNALGFQRVFLCVFYLYCTGVHVMRCASEDRDSNTSYL